MNRSPMQSLTIALLITVLAVNQAAGLVAPLDEVYFDHDASATLSRVKRAAEEKQVRDTCAPGVAIPKTRVDTTENLRNLRKLMKKEKIDAYIIPRSDEHASEYTAEYDRRRSWISGFDGSNGDAVVLKNAAALWTDGRYFLQAEEQLDCNWMLMKMSVPGVPNITSWLINNLRLGSNVVADPKLISQNKWRSYREDFSLTGINLISNYENKIDKIWSEKNGRPKPVEGTLYVHDQIFSGKSWEEKLKSVRLFLYETEADGIIISTLDEVAWLFNLRGNDVPYNPVFKSYALVAKDFVKLYVDLEKIDEKVKKHLKSTGCTSKNCVSLVKYSDIWADLKESLNPMNKVMITTRSSFALYETVPSEKREIIESPLIIMKTIKNPTEIMGMKNSHHRDSAVIIDFVSMLEDEIKQGKEWDELKAVETLSKLRAKQKHNRGESFATISAFASNGAVIHYKPNHVTNKRIDTTGVYLLDSGGQYLDGTTDITRTFHFGEPNDFEKEAYTRVLMGSIDLARLVFPKGTTDRNIDNIARKYLHEIGLDYNHGTGHGIGSFLNVHEPRIQIRKPVTWTFGNVLSPGMFMSDEPGYYEDKAFGVRLETIVMVKNMSTENNFNHIPYYGFESIALVPFEPNLIKYELLTKNHIDWINEYHKNCRMVIGDLLNIQGKQRAHEWLMEKSEPIKVKEECKTRAVVATPQKQCINSFTVKLTASQFVLLGVIILSYLLF